MTQCCNDFGQCTQGRDCPARALNTRRYPRTLESAFGPYTSRDLLEPADRRGETLTWWVAMAFIAAVALVLIWIQR